MKTILYAIVIALASLQTQAQSNKNKILLRCNYADSLTTVLYKNEVVQLYVKGNDGNTVLVSGSLTQIKDSLISINQGKKQFVYHYSSIQSISGGDLNVESARKAQKKLGIIWLITGILTITGVILIFDLNNNKDPLESLAGGCLSFIIGGVLISILLSAIFISIGNKKKNPPKNFPFEIPINAPSCKCDSPKLALVYKADYHAEVV